jgi:hypothetical protein
VQLESQAVPQWATLCAGACATGTLRDARRGLPETAVAIVVLLGMLAGIADAATPIKREGYGAPEADALGPVGGGGGYKNVVVRRDYLVKTASELIDALGRARPGQVVYVEDNAEIDMTVLVTAYQEKLVVPGGVTLASGRGRTGSMGALICSDQFNTPGLIQVGGPDVRISGLRLRGPDPKIRAQELAGLAETARKNGRNGDYYLFPTSDGIQSAHTRLVVDNCEIWGWSHAGVYAYNTIINAQTIKIHIHHNSIHHCQRAGLGYGVAVGDNCEALIEADLFDYTRHAIAATGRPGTCYEARNNVHGEHCTHFMFDMHGSVDSQGKKWDGHNIAGEWIKIHHNTFRSKVVAVSIGGLPREVCEVHHNWFFTQPADQAVRQLGDELGHMKVFDNVVDEDQRPWQFPGNRSHPEEQ